MNLATRWRQFVFERFPPASYGPMVVVFCVVNGAAGLYGRASELEPGTPSETAWFRALMITLLFFFRLRCFDEIKDYKVDLQINPTRPLARGLLTRRQVKWMIALAVMLEIFFILPSGLAALTTWMIACAYSFLMYFEFFVGGLIRPHLTTYAVLHTFVSTLIGFTIAAVMTGTTLRAGLPNEIYWMGLVNWMFFNLFEFARKTYAPEEERAGVETYSSLFGPWGAVALSFSQIVIALAALTVSRIAAWMNEPTLLTLYAIGAASTIPMLAYAVKPIASRAKTFRAASGAVLMIFYVVLAVHFLRGAAI